MLIPPDLSDMTEEQILSCINYVANKLAPQFIIGYYDLEDLKQEVRIFCLEGLHKYDKSRGKLSTFLMMVAQSRLINFKRNRLFRMSPKCGCSSCLSGIECEAQTKRMERWRKLNTTKRNLMNVNHMGDDDYEDILPYYNPDDIKEIVEIIDENLDISLREDYRRFVEGVKLPQPKREKIVSEIHRILKDLKYEL